MAALAGGGSARTSTAILFAPALTPARTPSATSCAHIKFIPFCKFAIDNGAAAPMLQGASIRNRTPDFKISNPFVTKLRDYESSMAGIYEKRSQYDQLFQNEHNHKNTNFMMIILLDVLLLYFTLVDSWQYGRKTRKGLGGY